MLRFNSTPRLNILSLSKWRPFDECSILNIWKTLTLHDILQPRFRKLMRYSFEILCIAIKRSIQNVYIKFRLVMLLIFIVIIIFRGKHQMADRRTNKRLRTCLRDNFSLFRNPESLQTHISITLCVQWCFSLYLFIGLLLVKFFFLYSNLVFYKGFTH